MSDFRNLANGPPIPLEPSDGPEASNPVLMKTPYGRVYCFYTHNTDNTRSLIPEHPEVFENGVVTRVDSQGHFAAR